MSVYFEVDLFQLNAARNCAGDSAIVLLVARTEPPQTDKRGAIKSAVLIDGGNGKEVGDLIEDVIVWIQTQYTMTTDYLEFDSVIITHYDADHTNGFLQWVKTPSLWDKAKTVFAHFKYDVQEVDGEDVTEPKTALYCQGPWPYTKKFNIKKHLLPFSDQEDVIGVNAFNNFPLDDEKTTWEATKTLADLIAYNDPWDNGDKADPWTGAPGLYIIGMGGDLIGETPEIASSPNGSGGYQVIDEGNDTDTNPNSLIMLLVWKNKDATKTPKVSLYTGGDAEFVMENKTANFVAGEQIKVYKGGHHGSAASTSTKFIEAVKPDHFIFSAGIQHGHPRQEVLLFIDIWLTNNVLKDPSTSKTITKRLHTLVYPYHFGQVLDSGIPRTFHNYFLNPDQLTIMYQNKVTPPPSDGTTLKKDVLYANFVDWTVKNYKLIDDVYMDIITKYSWDVFRYIMTQSYTLIPFEQKGGKTYEKAWDDFNAKKAAFIAPLLAPRFNVHSKSTYQNYAIRAYDKTETKPTDLVNLQYLLVTMGYDQTGGNDFLTTSVQYMVDGKEKLGTPSSIKVAKIDPNDPYAAQGLLGAGDDGPDAGTKKRKRDEPRPPPGMNNDGWLTIVDEDYIHKQEFGDDQVVPVDRSDINSPGYIVTEEVFGVVPNMNLNPPPQSLQDVALVPTLPNAIKPFGTDPAADVIVVTDGSNCDYFVASIRSQQLLLSSTTATGPNGWTATLSSSDTLQRWLQAFFVSPVTDIATQFNGSSFDNWDASVQLRMTMPAGDNGETNKTIRYNSTSSTVKSALDVSSDVTAVIDQAGFFNQTIGLVLGLDTSGDFSTAPLAGVTLSQVYTLLEIDMPVFLDGSTRLSFDTTVPQNAVWICPSDGYSVIYRLGLRGKTTSGYFLTAIPGFNFTESTLVATKRSRLQRLPNSSGQYQNSMFTESDVCIRSKTTVTSSDPKLSSINWDTYIDLSPTEVDLILRFSSSGTDVVGALMTWLGEDVLKINMGNAWSQFSNTLTNLDIHLRELFLSAKMVGNSWAFDQFRMTFELDLKWGTKTPDYRVPTELKFIYVKGASPYIAFQGDIWGQTTDDTYKLLPSSVPYPILSPDTTFSQQSYFSLLSMLSSAQQDAFPKQVIPSAVTSLSVKISTTDLSFSGTMQIDPDSAINPSSWLVLDQIKVYASRSNVDGSVAFEFYASLTLYPRDVSPTIKALIEFDIQYDTSTGWTFAGSATNLNVGALYSLFPGPESDAVMNVLEDITITTFDIVFHADNDNGTAFDASGVLMLGNVELDLTFSRNTVKTGSTTTTDWSFVATLSETFSTTGTNVGIMLGAVSDDLTSVLPDFIKNIGFAIPLKSSITLKCQKLATNTVILSLDVSVAEFEFTFIQINSAAQTTGDALPNRQTPKRLFKFTMNALPFDQVQGVPMLDKMTQPFDQMDFFWNSDDLTRQEVDMINSLVFTSASNRLIYSEPQTSDTRIVKTPGTKSPGDLVVLQACHFQVIAEENSKPTPVLDYAFAGKPTPPPPPSVQSGGSGGGYQAVAPSPQAKGNGTATNKWTKTIGPLTISSISLKFEDSVLWIMLDASVKMGPAGGSIKGFGIGMPLSKDLHSIDTSRSIQLTFSGIGLELVRPPVELAGMLNKTDLGYEGGVTIMVEPYTFIAAGGYYSHVPDPNDANHFFKSMFVFAELDGPIAEFELASLNGLCGGFGYNSQIVLPTIDQVTKFPFLQTASRKGTDPLSILNEYLSGGWFKPVDGPIWLAAGVTVDALASLTLKTVVVIDISESVTFGIYADAQADYPPGALTDDELFARVDMGLLAVIEPAKGIFHSEGQLTPRSFVLSKDCHLTGGFALCYWFDGSGHAGDWVFTIGGYHSQFVPPKWYPVPPRLAISWQYDSTISIYGEAFFAITPKMAMGGGKLKLAFVSGKLSATFDAYADFLINYRPFSFIADAGINVAIHYTMDAFFVTKTFDVHFGATVSLHGPPLAGTAHVDWCIISFDITFGSAKANSKPLTWPQFHALLRQAPENSLPDTTDKDTGQGFHTISSSSGTIGVVPDSSITGNNKDQQAIIDSKGTETILVNKSTFAFSIASLFPIKSINYADGSAVPNTVQDPKTTYIKPMQDGSGNTTSTLSIDITSTAGSPPTAGEKGKFWYQPIYKEVPTAIWGQYKANEDPTKGKTPATLLNTTGATTTQMMGVDLVAPLATPSNKAITFNIEKGSSYPVSTATLPSTCQVPTTIMSSSDLDSAMNVGAPITPEIPYPARTIVGRVTTPQRASSDIMAAWIKWNGGQTDNGFGARMAALSAETHSSPNWMTELLTAPTAPLPVLTAEASVKALMHDGTRFAGSGSYRGTGALLARDWLDGGEVF